MSKFIFDNENGNILFINPYNPRELCFKRTDSSSSSHVITSISSKLIDLNTDDEGELYAMDDDGILYRLHNDSLREVDKLCH